MNYNLKLTVDYTKTKFNILNTAFNLFNNYGYGEVTIADICKHAKISRSAFRGYYEKKAELLNELATVVLKEINDLVRKVTLSNDLNFYQKIIGVFKIGYEHKMHFNLIQQANLVSGNSIYLRDFALFLDESKMEFFSFLEKNIKESKKINAYFKKYDPRDISVLLFGYFEAVYYDTLPSHAKQSEATIINNLKIFVKP